MWWTPADRTGGLSARPDEFLRPAVADGALHRARVETTLQQLLAQLALARHAQEEPGEGDERDDRSLDHHHGAGHALIRERRHSPEPVLVRVDDVEDAARPEEDIAEDRLDDAHDRDVAELRARAEPLRSRQRLEHG